MNRSGSGSGSSKENIGSGSDKNLPLPPLPLFWYLRQEFQTIMDFSKMEAEAAILEAEAG